MAATGELTKRGLSARLLELVEVFHHAVSRVTLSKGNTLNLQLVFSQQKTLPTSGYENLTKKKEVLASDGAIRILHKHIFKCALCTH